MISKIPIKEEILEVLSNRILNTYPQQKLITSFIELSKKAKNKERAKDLIVKLINSNNYKVGLDSFSKHNPIFIQKHNDEIGKAIISKYKGYPPNKWGEFLDYLVGNKECFSNRFVDEIGETFQVHIENDDINIRNIGKEYYLMIRDKISDKKVNYIGQQLITKLLAIINTINENAKPIFDVLIEEQDRLEREKIESLIDILLKITHESRPTNVRNMAFNYLGDMKKLYKRSTSVLDQLLDLSERSKAGERELIIKNLASLKKFKGRKGFWEKAKTHFIELSRSDNENDKKIGNWVLRELKNNF